ncbi:PD40 domain-containing protein [Granulicella sp. dw_53]|uniref:PD40 domain-containing protein n=1 Tax=Granulicella sp. dw_53 TaxID=2719792 RepID=UPI001BD3EC03|nr:PD40 domain-containing protein [Granulicella sp. dw_53]
MENFHENVRKQLERLAVSAEFGRTDRMVRFLRFVVERSLEEDADALRERQIGIEVFDRPSDWDPKLDNVVRSEARRLRAKLDAYAASNNPDETVRITIPKGGYVAEFVELPSSRTPPEVLSQSQSTVTSAEGFWRRIKSPVSVAAASVLVVLAAVGSSSLISLRRSVQAKADSFDIVPFSNEIGQQFSPSIAPDGTRVAYVWDGNADNYDIYIKDLKTSAVVRLTDDKQPDIHPAWSPNGREVAFLRRSQSGTEVFVKPVGGGAEHAVGAIRDTSGLWASENPFSGCQSPTWTPDARQLLLTDGLGKDYGAGLVLISVDSGTEKPLTSPRPQDEDCYPRFSQDGKRIAFVRYISHGAGEIFTMAADGTDLKQLTTDHRNIRGVDWASDGRHLIFASNRRGSYELREIDRNGGESQPLPSDTASASEPAISRTGDWMAFVESDENWNIWRVPIQNGRIGSPKRFLASRGRNHSPSFSPDGQTIAFVSDRSGTPEIWFANGDGSSIRQMTHFGGPWLGTIRWSPDSKAIVFDARPNGNSEIFTMSTSGGKPTLLEHQQFEVRRPGWSRDGKSVYFDTTRGGMPQIWRRTLTTGATRPIAPQDTLYPSESMDGQTLFFFSGNGRGEHNIWSERTDGSELKQIPGVHPDPDLDWAVSKDGIYFAVSDAASARLNFYSFRDARITAAGKLAQALSLGTPSLVVSPDGKWLLYACIDSTKSDIKIRRESALVRNR